MSPESWPLWAVTTLFVAAAAVIALAGTRLTRLADRLADVTGLGEAIFGAVLLGGTTSLPGIVTSVTAAWNGHAELAFSNAVGGIAAQTAFLALADITYRRANLEHAAASVENLLQGALLVTLLALPLMATGGPEITLFAMHPMSGLLLVGYVFGLRLASQTRSQPAWLPRRTLETQLDEGEPEAARRAEPSVPRLWLDFSAMAAIVMVAGYTVARAGIALSERTGLSETLVGSLFTAVATSLPELITVMAAVRQGALTLAVGDIIGGNSFDVLFLAFADVAYRPGSLYHAIGGPQVFMIALSQVMTGILLLGLLRREKTGIANIGFESFLVLVFYFGSLALLFFL